MQAVTTSAKQRTTILGNRQFRAMFTRRSKSFFQHYVGVEVDDARRLPRH